MILQSLRSTLEVESHREALGLLNDRVTRFFTEHENGRHGKKPGEARQGGAIHDPQPLHPSYPEAAIQNRFGIAIGPNLSCTRSVMSPSLVFDPLSHILSGLN